MTFLRAKIPPAFQTFNFFRFVIAIYWVLLSVGLTYILGNGDPMVFVRFDPDPVNSEGNQFEGYDGQFAYLIALDPIGAVDKMDVPTWRYLRILYPLIAWVISFGGNPSLVPWALIGINVISAAAATILLGKLIHRRGHSPWYALALTCFVGMFFSVFMDLNEPLSVAFILLAIDRYEEDRFFLSLVFFAFAALTKETAIIFPIGLGVWLALSRNWKKLFYLIAISLLPWALWVIIVRYWTGTSATWILGLVRLVPFSGLGGIRSLSLFIFSIIWILGPMVLLVWVIASDLRTRQWSWESWVVVGNMLFIAIQPSVSWNDLIALYRYIVPFVAISLIYTASRNSRVFRILSINWSMS